MCISTIEALQIIESLIDEDIDICCESLMDKDEVYVKLSKLKEYIEDVNSKEDSVSLHSPLEDYF